MAAAANNVNPNNAHMVVREVQNDWRFSVGRVFLEFKRADQAIQTAMTQVCQDIQAQVLQLDPSADQLDIDFSKLRISYFSRDHRRHAHIDQLNVANAVPAGDVNTYQALIARLNDVRTSAEKMSQFVRSSILGVSSNRNMGGSEPLQINRSTNWEKIQCFSMSDFVKGGRFKAMHDRLPAPLQTTAIQNGMVVDDFSRFFLADLKNKLRQKKQELTQPGQGVVLTVDQKKALGDQIRNLEAVIDRLSPLVENPEGPQKDRAPLYEAAAYCGNLQTAYQLTPADIAQRATQMKQGMTNDLQQRVKGGTKELANEIEHYALDAASLLFHDRVHNEEFHGANNSVAKQCCCMEEFIIHNVRNLHNPQFDLTDHTSLGMGLDPDSAVLITNALTVARDQTVPLDNARRTRFTAPPVPGLAPLDTWQGQWNAVKPVERPFIL